MSTQTQKRRILTIDGGGLKGIVPATMLAEIELHIDSPLVDYFDLIVGTSTGGIIAAGLAIGLSAAEIVEIYKDSGPRIFPTLTRSMRAWLALAGIVRSKFPTVALRQELERHFGGKLVGASRTRLVLPSWSPVAQTVHVWKTRHCGRFRNDHRKPMVEALVSTASAPTYFSSAARDGGSGLIDGGVWANNPMLVATIEALGVLNWAPQSVHMLSLGCVREDYIAPSAGGLLRWAMPASQVFLQAQSSSAIGGTHLLLGDRPNTPSRVFRLEASAPKGHFLLDDASGLEMMQHLGRAMARHHLDHLLPIFFDEPALAFSPLPDDALDNAVA